MAVGLRCSFRIRSTPMENLANTLLKISCNW
ncbi:hypothetical protein J2850_005565 [Azospirillum picis]|uniref:Uncharacterized protein n=1 Tax=Azospirillum picis TaxID=488438 RepID=A0ABU0MSP6_9PROT|nr:hypothetical protein [Azospirillum picis]MDQ0536514.1 hypothetical protein [Azospirillum picis]